MLALVGGNTVSGVFVKVGELVGMSVWVGVLDGCCTGTGLNRMGK